MNALRLRSGLAALLMVGLACAHESPPPVSPAAAPAQFSREILLRIDHVQPIVQRAASVHRLDAALINGVIWVESRFDPRAKSPAGARGLMQLMPATAEWLADNMGGVRARSFDPEFNVTAGTYYLARLRHRYKGDVRLALAAYHAGPGNVDRWIRRGGLPSTSREYVARVFAARDRFVRLRP